MPPDGMKQRQWIEDLLSGYHFYERQVENLGNYFLDSLYADLQSLAIYAGFRSGQLP